MHPPIYYRYDRDNESHKDALYTSNVDDEMPTKIVFSLSSDVQEQIDCVRKFFTALNAGKAYGVAGYVKHMHLDIDPITIGYDFGEEYTSPARLIISADNDGLVLQVVNKHTQTHHELALWYTMQVDEPIAA